MEACLQPQVSCRLINGNHQAEKERYTRNRKSGKIQSKERLDCVQLFMCTCVFVCACESVCVSVCRLY